MLCGVGVRRGYGELEKSALSELVGGAVIWELGKSWGGGKR